MKYEPRKCPRCGIDLWEERMMQFTRGTQVLLQIFHIQECMLKEVMENKKSILEVHEDK